MSWLMICEKCGQYDVYHRDEEWAQAFCPMCQEPRIYTEDLEDENTDQRS
jgi:hypothetical protein